MKYTAHTQVYTVHVLKKSNTIATYGTADLFDVCVRTDVRMLDFGLCCCCCFWPSFHGNASNKYSHAHKSYSN